MINGWRSFLPLDDGKKLLGAFVQKDERVGVGSVLEDEDQLVSVVREPQAVYFDQLQLDPIGSVHLFSLSRKNRWMPDNEEAHGPLFHFEDAVTQCVLLLVPEEDALTNVQRTHRSLSLLTSWRRGEGRLLLNWFFLGYEGLKTNLQR